MLSWTVTKLALIPSQTLPDTGDLLSLYPSQSLVSQGTMAHWMLLPPSLHTSSPALVQGHFMMCYNMKVTFCCVKRRKCLEGMLAGPALEAGVGAVLLLHTTSSVSKRCFFTWVPKEYHNLLKTLQGSLGFFFMLRFPQATSLPLSLLSFQ